MSSRKQMRSMSAAKEGFSGLHRVSCPTTPRVALTGGAWVLAGGGAVGTGAGAEVGAGRLPDPEPPGMESTWPGKIKLGLGMTLLARIAWAVTPHFSAMIRSVSPRWMVYSTGHRLVPPVLLGGAGGSGVGTGAVGTV